MGDRQRDDGELVEGRKLMGRSTPSVLLSEAPLPSKPVKPHDWTYSTCFAGSTAGPSVSRHSRHLYIPLRGFDFDLPF